MNNIPVRFEAKRGCGYRKPGGYYAVVPVLPDFGCGKLPLILETCPTCGAGIRPSRSFTWIDPVPLFSRNCPEKDYSLITPPPCSCALEEAHLAQLGRMGLIWVGEKFYPTPEAFMIEAHGLGISRRLSRIPRGFVLGETYIALAHRKCCFGWTSDPETNKVEPIHKPGIFYVFKPDALEYVVRGDESEKALENLAKRGIQPVRVVPDYAQKALVV